MTQTRTAVDGYTDTPFLPGSSWRVHDKTRTQPPLVEPGAKASEGAQPPSDAVVLFDGSDLSGWVTTRTGDAAGWKVENGYMEVAKGTGNIQTHAKFGDCQLHLEFATPVEIVGQGQGRGNSGVFLLGLYEVQVLDNYDNPTYADGTCGAVYGQHPPLVNVCRKPGEWQTYDIVFNAPRWGADGKLVSPARLTVFLNGVLVQHAQAAQGPTNHKTLADYNTPHAPEGPLMLQDHGNPMRFRNIWVRPIASAAE
jgi:hypothetical protein